MRILLCITSLSSGGAERVMSVLANAFSNDEHNVTLIHFSEKKEYYSLKKDINLIRGFRSAPAIPGIYHFFTLYSIYRSISNELRTSSYDLVISFLPFVNLMSILASNKSKVPVIISERSNPEMSTNTFALNLLRKFIYQRASASVLQTNGVVEAFSRMGIVIKMPRVIPNPIEDKFLETPPKGVKEKIILSVGRLSQEKGHKDLIFALIELAKRIDLREHGWKILIIGDGPERLALEEMVENGGLIGIVEFLGNKRNVIDYYHRSEIFVLPSISEGFPNVLLEAMACSCACVSFDCEYGPNEILTHNENGLLVPSRNTSQLATELISLILNINLRLRLQHAARAKMKEYSSSLISNKWMEMANSLVVKKEK